MKTTLLLVVVLLLTFFSVKAQEVTADSIRTEFRQSVWIDAGLGIFDFNAGFNLQVKKSILLSYNIDASVASIFDNADPRRDFTTNSLMVGIVWKKPFGIAQYSIGPSLVEAKGYDFDYPRAGDFNTIGIKVKAAWFLSYKVIGIGISPYAVLNTKASYFGLTANIALGQLNILKK